MPLSYTLIRVGLAILLCAAFTDNVQRRYLRVFVVKVPSWGIQVANWGDSNGNQISVTYPTTSDFYRPTVSTTYNQYGESTRRTDQLGNVQTVDYDSNFWPKLISDSPNGSPAVVRSFLYNANGTKQAESAGNTRAYGYDAAGNRTVVKDANGNRTEQIGYDDRRRITGIGYPGFMSKSFTYDTADNLTQVVNEDGRAVQYTYDALDQLVAVIQSAAPDPSHNTTAYGFDLNGNLTSWTDANGHTTQNGFDLANELNSEILPSGGPTQTHNYDSAGNLTSLLDFNGKTTSYSYDSLNRLLTVTPDSTLGDVAVSFTYTPTGQRAGMTDASGTTNYTYDSSDRLITKATPAGTLTYTYDPAGNLASLSNGNSASASYTWGALGKLASVVDNRLPPGQNTTTYTYDVNENLATVTYPNGLQSTLAYDGLSRLTGFNSGKTSYSYQLGATGNRTSVQESTGRSLNWNYDGIYRLTNEKISNDPAGNNGSIGYGLDPVGNRPALSSGLAKILSSTSSFDANDRLASETYDSDGNTLISGGRVFKYDFANRLKSMNNGAVTLVYDGDGNRVAKTVAGATTQYLVDDLNPTGLPQVVDELVNGSVQRTYTYGSQRISQYQNISGPWTPSFYGYDGGFHVRLLTDITGAVTDTYDYDAFGSLVNSTGSTPNNYLYRGEQWDAHLGLYYLRARYYNPGTGRFLSRDQHQNTVKHPRTLHRYLYSSSDPVNRKDPKGLEDDLEYTEVTKSEAKIARLLGRSLKEVKNAIHALKRDIDFEGNPDVFIDINNFNVFVETYSGDVGDLLANLFDYLD